MPLHNVQPYQGDQVILDNNAADTEYVHELVAYDENVHTDVKSPDKAKCVTVSLFNNSGGGLALQQCTCTITGITKFGEDVTEDVQFQPIGNVPDQETVTSTGTKIVDKISQYQFTGAQPVGWEMSVGIGNKLGFNHKLQSVLGVVAIKRNDEDDPVEASITLQAGGYIDCVASDIGKEVTDDTAAIGVLRSYDNVNRIWKVVAYTTTQIGNGSAMAVSGGTGQGTSSGNVTPPYGIDIVYNGFTPAVAWDPAGESITIDFAIE